MTAVFQENDCGHSYLKIASFAERNQADMAVVFVLLWQAHTAVPLAKEGAARLFEQGGGSEVA